VETADGANIVLNKTGTIQILDSDEKELETTTLCRLVPPCRRRRENRQGAVLAQWDPYNIPVLSEKGGTLVFKDMIPGVTVKRELDESSGRIANRRHRAQEDLNPQVEIRDAKNKPLAAYSIPVGAQIAVNGRATRSPPRLARQDAAPGLQRQGQSPGGLPRVAELFEARRPKEAAEMSRIDGIVFVRGHRPRQAQARREERGDRAGEEHSDRHRPAHHRAARWTSCTKASTSPMGAADPHEILEILGPSALYDFLISQVQEVYRLQGVTINDKHIEIIIRQMLPQGPHHRSR